jgi:proton-dependent oligopeptide transporter, POT family
MNRKDIFGHPPGLWWLAGTEFWERFSYYGMQALLVLYMTHYLLQPGHVDAIWAFVPFRTAIEWFYGPLSPAALASIIFGLYAGLVYVTPIAGGLLADRLTGRTVAVTLGALLMAAGHFMMAFDASFLLALLCLLTGVGCFKGNIAVQVGDLYAETDARRANAFQIYYLGIQISVILSPLICGTLGQRVAWHLGFGAAGVGMLIGLAIYLTGRPTFPQEKKRADGEVVRPPLTGRDMRSVIVLSLLVPVLALSLVGNQEIFNAYMIWGEKYYQLVFFGHTMPVTWLQSMDAIFGTATIAGMVLFWRWYGARWKEPDEITKMTIGVAISACAPLTLAAASLAANTSGHPVSIAWAFAFELLNDVGFANVLPVGLALYSRAAPKGLEGMMIAVYYLQFFLGNMLVGYLGSLYEKMPAIQFWLLHVGLMAVSALVLLVARRMASSLLAANYKTA